MTEIRFWNNASTESTISANVSVRFIAENLIPDSITAAFDLQPTTAYGRDQEYGPNGKYIGKTGLWRYSTDHLNLVSDEISLDIHTGFLFKKMLANGIHSLLQFESMQGQTWKRELCVFWYGRARSIFPTPTDDLIHLARFLNLDVVMDFDKEAEKNDIKDWIKAVGPYTDIELSEEETKVLWSRIQTEKIAAISENDSLHVFCNEYRIDNKRYNVFFPVGAPLDDMPFIHRKEPFIGPNVFDYYALCLLKETEFLSSPTQMKAAPTYSFMLEIGDKAIPMILDRMRTGVESTVWFLLLADLTGEQPVKPEHAGFVDEISKDWLAWGKDRYSVD